jgi:Fe-S-cluster containining protein
VKNLGMTDPTPLAAGNFSAWLEEVQAAIAGEAAADVPCGGCTACCTSSQFIHIGPDETDTLSHIDPNLLVPAPRLARGHVVLGYDEQGHCPMLIDNACSIYEHRPRTCRTYDCRIFPAAGIEPGDDKIDIGNQTQRWRFGHPSANDQAHHDAVRAAAAFVQAHAEVVPDTVSTSSSTQVAVLAIRAHEAFLSRDDCGNAVVVHPTADEVRVAITRPTAAPTLLAPPRRRPLRADRSR